MSYWTHWYIDQTHIIVTPMAIFGTTVFTSKLRKLSETNDGVIDRNDVNLVIRFEHFRQYKCNMRLNGVQRFHLHWVSVWSSIECWTCQILVSTWNAKFLISTIQVEEKIYVTSHGTCNFDGVLTSFDESILTFLSFDCTQYVAQM